MTETKSEKFQRVSAPRIRAASKALDLLPNLIRAEYESNVFERVEIVRMLASKVDSLARAWGVEVARGDTPQPVLSSPAAAVHQVGLAMEAEGGVSLENEIRWAIDMILRGEYDAATSRLRRCLE